MSNVFHVAASGGEAIFWVVAAVIAIIVQIIKSRAEQAPRPQGSSPEGDDPGEELRKFLESLGGQTTGASRPASPPPAPASPPPPPVRGSHAPQGIPAGPRPRVVDHSRTSAARPDRVLPTFVTTRGDEYIPSAAVVERPQGATQRTGSLGKEIGDEVDGRRRDDERQEAHKEFRKSLLTELRSSDPKPVQKAIVLSELLGTPVGLRQASQAPGAVRY